MDFRDFIFIGQSCGYCCATAGACLKAGARLKPLRGLRQLPHSSSCLIARAVQLEQIPFACLLALGFNGLLRTGELLKVASKDLEISSDCGILRLPLTKSGIRAGADEAIAIRDRLALQLLDTWMVVYQPSPGSLIWNHSAQKFRGTLRQYLRFFGISHAETLYTRSGEAGPRGSCRLVCSWTQYC